MKAIILAGGKGTRLRPLTHEVPKALIPVGGKALTEHILDILKKYGVKDVILSVAHMKGEVKAYFKDGAKFGFSISYVEEPEPLGTAGPLIILNREGKPLRERFFMLNGDNLFDVSLKEMLEFHVRNKATATIALSTTDDPRQYGVAVLDGDRITEFVEKPEKPPTKYINSGYYIMEPDVFDMVKGKEKAMIERDIFPELARKGKLFGFRCEGMWFDTGTPERYDKVKKEWKFE